MSKRLDTLMQLMQDRGVGNTELMLNGLAYQKPAVLIFATQLHVSMTFDNIVRSAPHGIKIDRVQRKIGSVQFVSVANLDRPEWWRGKRVAVGIDHFALTELIKEERLEWQARLEKEGSK